MDTKKEKELYKRVHKLETLVEAQTRVVEKCHDLMERVLDTQTRLIEAVGGKNRGQSAVGRG